MLEVRYKLLDGLYHLSLGEVLLLEDALQLLEEPIHKARWKASSSSSIEPSMMPVA